MRDYWQDVMTGVPDSLTLWHSALAPREVHLYAPPSHEVLRSLVVHFRQTLAIMKSTTAAGMDQWPSSILHVLVSAPVDCLLCLLLLLDGLTQGAYWPRCLLQVRTHLLPKVAGGGLAVSDYRPISLTSLFYRIWSSWQLATVDKSVFRNLPEDLLGGLPGRDARERIVYLAMATEAAQLGVGEEEHRLTCVLNMDAVKCFDRIPWDSACRATLSAGVNPDVVRALSSFWFQHERTLSCAGRLDTCAFRVSRSVLQGCALSVLSTVCVTAQWHSVIIRPGITAQAFMDDRTVGATSATILEEVWADSQQWEGENGWQINARKSEVLVVSPPAQTPGCLCDYLPRS
eukprot:6484930-Amphidinium_carterae.1